MSGKIGKGWAGTCHLLNMSGSRGREWAPIDDSGSGLGLGAARKRIRLDIHSELEDEKLGPPSGQSSSTIVGNSTTAISSPAPCDWKSQQQYSGAHHRASRPTSLSGGSEANTWHTDQHENMTFTTQRSVENASNAVVMSERAEQLVSQPISHLSPTVHRGLQVPRNLESSSSASSSSMVQRLNLHPAVTPASGLDFQAVNQSSVVTMQPANHSADNSASNSSTRGAGVANAGHGFSGLGQHGFAMSTSQGANSRLEIKQSSLSPSASPSSSLSFSSPFTSFTPSSISSRPAPTGYSSSSSSSSFSSNRSSTPSISTSSSSMSSSMSSLDHPSSHASSGRGRGPSTLTSIRPSNPQSLSEDIYSVHQFHPSRPPSTTSGARHQLHGHSLNAMNLETKIRNQDISEAFHEGQIWNALGDLDDFIANFELMKRQKFRRTSNTKRKVYTCIHKPCEFTLQVNFQIRKGAVWVVKRLILHTCTQPAEPAKASQKQVLECLVQEHKLHLDHLTNEQLRASVTTKLGLFVTDSVFRKAKSDLLAILKRERIESYSLIPSFVSVCEYGAYEVNEKSQLTRLFVLAPGARKLMLTLLPIISVDATFADGYLLIVAATIDNQRQRVPIAWGVIETEDTP